MNWFFLDAVTFSFGPTDDSKAHLLNFLSVIGMLVGKASVGWVPTHHLAHGGHPTPIPRLTPSMLPCPHSNPGEGPVMTVMNVVHMRVKPGMEEEFVRLHHDFDIKSMPGGRNFWHCSSTT